MYSVAASSVIDEIRRRLADHDDAAYDDDTVLAAINDGIERFCTVTNCLRASGTITGNGTKSIAFAELPHEPLKVVAMNTQFGKLDLATPHQIAAGWSGDGAPSAYCVWGDRVYFDVPPAPGCVITVYYSYVHPRLMQPSSLIAMKREWIRAIVSYAVYQLRDMDREGALAGRAYAEYEAIVAATLANQGSEAFQGGL
jgi:hypothetical protein